jgi:hypothetical protein
MVMIRTRTDTRSPRLLVRLWPASVVSWALAGGDGEVGIGIEAPLGVLDALRTGGGGGADLLLAAPPPPPKANEAAATLPTAEVTSSFDA